MIQILMIVAFIAALIGGAELYIKNRVDQGKAQEQAKQLARDNEELKNELSQRKKITDLSNDISVMRAEQAKENEKLRAVVDKRIAALAASDPEVKSWLATRVPESLRQLRRNTAGVDQVGDVRSAPVAPATNPSPAPQRPNQRRPTDRGGSTAPLAPVVQREQAGRSQDTDVPKSAALERINQIRKGLKP